MPGSGDVNGDSKVDIDDLELALQHVASSLVPTCVLAAADFDGNGVLNSADLAQLQLIVQK